MSATTIKIEDPLLSRLGVLVGPKRSLSAFVREVLEREVRKHQMARAAHQYASLIKSAPEEDSWLKAWDRAPLDTPPKLSRKIKKK